jgi:hypothetical protein
VDARPIVLEVEVGQAELQTLEEVVADGEAEPSDPQRHVRSADADDGAPVPFTADTVLSGRGSERDVAVVLECQHAVGGVGGALAAPNEIEKLERLAADGRVGIGFGHGSEVGSRHGEVMAPVRDDAFIVLHGESERRIAGAGALEVLLGIVEPIGA